MYLKELSIYGKNVAVFFPQTKNNIYFKWNKAIIYKRKLSQDNIEKYVKTFELNMSFKRYKMD